jgi:hypothetical protein
MASPIFEICRMLDAAKVRYFIEREPGAGTLLLTVAFVGERVEIDVFEDDHIEISRFHGDESIEEREMDLLRELVERETEGC